MEETIRQLKERILVLENQETELLEKLLVREEAFKAREEKLKTEILELRSKYKKGQDDDEIGNIVAHEREQIQFEELNNLRTKYLEAQKKIKKLEEEKSLFNTDKTSNLKQEITCEHKAPKKLQAEAEELYRAHENYSKIQNNVQRDQKRHRQNNSRKEKSHQHSATRQDAEDEVFQNEVVKSTNADCQSVAIVMGQEKEESTSHRIIQLQDELCAADSTVAELKQQNNALRHDLEELRASFNAILDDASSKSDYSKALEETIAMRENELTSLKASMAELSSELTKSRDGNTESQCTIEKLEETNQNILKNYELLQSKMKDLSNTLQEKDNACKQLEDISTARLLAAEQATMRYQDLEKKLRNVEDGWNEMKGRYERSESKQKKLSLEVESLKSIRRQLENRISDLQSRVDILNREKIEEKRNLMEKLAMEKKKAQETESVCYKLRDKINQVKNGKNPFDWDPISLDKLPVPPFGMKSAAIQCVLREWTRDESKIASTNQWFEWVLAGGDVLSSQSLLFENLSAEVREGFIKLIVPMLTQRNDLDILLESLPVVQGTTLRLKVKQNRDSSEQ